jgi:ABC-type multidrug transport system fused ATPase/permease subunit
MLSAISSSLAVFAQTLLVALIPFVVIHASSRLHDTALVNLFRAPIAFFQQNSCGRILNRFSSDVASTDTQMTNVFFVLSILIHSFLVQLCIIVSSNWMIVFGILVVLGLFAKVFLRFQPCNRELKRLLSLLKSPLDSHLTQSIHGTLFINTFQVQEVFETKMDTLLDQFQSAAYLKQCLSIWVNLRLQFLASLISLVVMLVAIWTHSDSSAVAFVGLAISASTGIALNLYEILIWFGNGESEMNSVERLLYYCHELPSENIDGEIMKLKMDWPKSGTIEFKNIQLVFPKRPDYPVLEGITFRINDSEQIAVVGRTGAGKSSLLTVLLRLIEPSDGKIHVDGFDISKIALQTLRKAMFMIPQKPIFFQGTIRENLDPLQEFSDDQLWFALERVGLKDFITFNNGLEFGISEYGLNLSVGQRQLLSISIGILKNPKILLLDEVTSSMDTESELLIQQIISKEFADTTVICVAHRLQAIMNFDRIVIMDNGRIVETGSPQDLLSKSSIFKNMAHAAGIQ